MTEQTTSLSTLSLVKRYLTLAYGALGTMLDIGLMVLGSLLVGLAVAVLLAGFDLVNVSQDLSTGAMLISAVVLAVTGLFCLGVASEGPLGRGRRLVGFKLWEVGVGRVLAVLGVGFAALMIHGVISGLLEGLPEPLHKGTEGIRAVGLSGLISMPLIGVPLSLLTRWAPVLPAWARRADIPVMFVVWAIAAFTVLN